MTHRLAMLWLAICAIGVLALLIGDPFLRGFVVGCVVYHWMTRDHGANPDAPPV